METMEREGEYEEEEEEDEENIRRRKTSEKLQFFKSEILRISSSSVPLTNHRR